MSNTNNLALLAIAGGLLVGASAFVTPRNGAATTAGDTVVMNDLTVTAFDYAFEMPDTVASGRTRVRLVNRGPELHHVFFVKLEEGKRLHDLFAAMQGHDGPLPSWTRAVGGPNTPVPGGESATVVDLAAGTYAVLCVIPSPDGTMHVMKGMAKELVVAEGRPTATVAVPVPTHTMRLRDYAFELDKPLVAGPQAVRVITELGQPHEVLFVKLAPGKSAADFNAWVHAPNGPPPGAPIGGTTVIEAGKENTVLLDLEPGEYALLCFLPDAKDGKMHIMHGMIRQVTVQ